MRNPTFTIDSGTADSLETASVLKALIQAHRALAELKGVARAIPNERILLSTLSLQEAQSSSAIENIITTQDALHRYRLQPDYKDAATKEVACYVEALQEGYNTVKETGLLTNNGILRIQELLEGNTAGFRKVPGTVLRNELSGEIVFTPPPPQEVPDLMQALEHYINEPNALDPLVRMALIHYQFETIHPFYDGNGRTGRIINILFLVKEGLLDSPILYLSRYINQNKRDYYQLLQSTRDDGTWEAWLLYIITGVSQTAKHTTQLVEGIRDLLQRQKLLIRENYRFYSQDLLNNLFSHPYTKVAFVEKAMGVSRATATRYLDALAKDGILHKQRIGRESYYINHELAGLLFNLPPMSP